MIMISEMNKEQLFECVVDLLVQLFELDRAKLTLQSRLVEDLDIDSIDAVDLAVQLKQRTGKRLSPDVFKEIRTIEDVVLALENLADSAQDGAKQI